MSAPTASDLEGRLEASQNHLVEASHQLTTGSNALGFRSDWFVLGAAKRAITLSASIFMLVDTNHGIGALTLCRPHLDTLLRLHSLWLTNDPHGLVDAVFEGKRLEKLKDRDGKQLRDTYLVDQLESAGLPWVRSVYQQTSGYVHLSDASMFQIFTDFDDETRVAKVAIGVEHKIPATQTLELKHFAIEVNREVAKRVELWVAYKAQALKQQSK